MAIAIGTVPASTSPRRIADLCLFVREGISVGVIFDDNILQRLSLFAFIVPS